MARARIPLISGPYVIACVLTWWCFFKLWDYPVILSAMLLAHQVKSQCIIGFCLSLWSPHVRVDDTLLYYEAQATVEPVVTKGLKRGAW